MCREAVDDFRRYRRDKEANSQQFKMLTNSGVVRVPSSSIKVGDLVIVEKVTPLCCCCFFVKYTHIYMYLIFNYV
ncbi:hypothetical protein DPMN_174155 [Dreissena polymorpha]|uniref:Uncharacterized protein n=1 Tax=Dreissena polymorpha TaxID=45954 RepID=A0A9D4E484_DREPO|nr:hypothetical protein DPMN_174155 [Dreissena polymorpha]